MTYSFSQTPVAIDTLRQLACFDSLGIKQIRYTKEKYKLSLLEIQTLRNLNAEKAHTITALTLKDQNNSIIIDRKDDLIKKKNLQIKKNKLFSRIKEGAFGVLIILILI